MNAKYPYLDIAISVLNQDNKPVNYSFNSAPAIALPSLSGLGRHFVNLSDGYVMWQVGGRRAFTYFQLNDEGTATVLAVTVRLDPDVLIAGRPIVNLLGTIRRTLTDDKKLTHESLMRILGDSGFPEDNPLRSEAAVDLPAAATGLCCRTYISSTELANIMAYPRQELYNQYQGVVVVPATVSMQPESTIPLITEPIDKALMVVCPDDATASAMRVELSDHLTVTYNMAGFDPQTVEFEVGTTNRYVRINGPALVVNSARHAGIIFTRSVPYTVTSPSGAKLDTYTILINGRTATRGEGSFTVSNTDFVDDHVTIAVSSTNYGSYSREFTPEELSEAAPLDIVLEPEARKINLRLDFGGGRIIEDSITLEKSTPEYNALRAGSFHGFRAHRMMGAKPETYNVDVRQGAQAAAPVQPALNFSEPAPRPAAAVDLSAKAEEPAKKPEAPKPAAEAPKHHGPVAPAIEKAPSAIWEEKPQKRVAPKFENVTEEGRKKEAAERREKIHRAASGEKPTAVKIEKAEEKTDGGSKGPKVDMRLIIVGVAVVAIALVIWWIMLLFSGTDEPKTAEQPQAETIEEVNYSEVAGQTDANQPAATAQAQPAAAAAPVAAANDVEKADVEYLNANNTWRLEDLKSEKYRALIKAMQAGDIQAVASNPYFSVAGTATNKKAIDVVNYLWKAKGTHQENNNVKRLSEATKADKANLQELIDKLSRCQDVKPNTEPRPGAN